MSIAVCTRSVATAVALALAFAAPSASAQADADQPAAGAPKPKPGKKPNKKKKPADKDDTKPAAEESKPALSADEPAPAKPEKEAAKPAEGDAKPAEGEAKPADAEGKKIEEGLPEDKGDEMTNTYEDPNKRYYFLGLRYRGTIIPQFIENLFVDDGGTVYSNSFGAELDMRKGGQSMIPWIVYADYSMGDTLFHEKGATPTMGTGNAGGDAGNITVVNSSLKALYLGLDELWSIPLDKSHHWDFEFGFGVGVGVVFGSLQNNWVFQNNNGNLVAADGTHYSECLAFNNSPNFPSCTVAGHTGATTAKINGYVEKNWFNGGAVPVFFPHISFPQLGIRYKPIKKMEARLGIGFSLTGFWFGLSADYGLEETEVKTTPAKPALKESGLLKLHDML